MALSTQAANRKDIRSDLCSMEHRHFAAIAAMLRNMPRGAFPADGPAYETIVNHFANELRATNPRFDRQRFMAACRP